MTYNSQKTMKNVKLLFFWTTFAGLTDMIDSSFERICYVDSGTISIYTIRSTLLSRPLQFVVLILAFSVVHAFCMLRLSLGHVFA